MCWPSAFRPALLKLVLAIVPGRRGGGQRRGSTGSVCYCLHSRQVKCLQLTLFFLVNFYGSFQRHSKSCLCPRLTEQPVRPCSLKNILAFLLIYALFGRPCFKRAKVHFPTIVRPGADSASSIGPAAKPLKESLLTSIRLSEQYL